MPWGSTTSLKTTDEFAIAEKLVLIANHIPRGEDTRAFLQRALHFKVALTDEALAELLTEAASSEKLFRDVALANVVARYLVENMRKYKSSEINIRTLRKGYEISRAKG